MRVPTAPSTLWAIARASTVFAVPGTSSNSTWPPEASAASTSRISSRFPWTTVSTFASRRAATSTARSNRTPTGCSSIPGAVIPAILGGGRPRRTSVDGEEAPHARVVLVRGRDAPVLQLAAVVEEEEKDPGSAPRPDDARGQARLVQHDDLVVPDGERVQLLSPVPHDEAARGSALTGLRAHGDPRVAKRHVDVDDLGGLGRRRPGCALRSGEEHGKRREQAESEKASGHAAIG